MRLHAATGRQRALVVLVAALVVSPGLAVHTAAASSDDAVLRPVDLVRASVARVQEVVHSNRGRGSETTGSAIREISERLFDFEAMSRRMLARHWNDGSPEQQEEFVRLLTSFLGRTYLDVIVSGASVRTTVDGQSIDGDYARVRTRMSVDVGPEASIEYCLVKRDERWAVYDVVHEGASLVANYRSQFASVLRTSSFAELLERMRNNERQAQSRTETGAALGRRLLLFSVVAERGAR
jgi:phospholipid transport system substrate-binding protein